MRGFNRRVNFARMIYMRLRNKFCKLKRRRIVITFIAFVFLCVHLQRLSAPRFSFASPDLYFLYWGPSDNVSCHYIETDDTLPHADSAFFLPPARSVFFLETTCRGDLNSRQACAVESAARVYPEWQIHVLFAAPVTRFALKTGSLAVLSNYSNVNLYRVNVVKYARGTPLEKFIAGGALNKTRWRFSHTSDLLRYLCLFKFGGMYFDLDMVVVKEVDPLTRNWAARESDTTVAAGALAFSRDEVGRSMAEAAIRDIINNYRGDDWGNNGPGVITRVLYQRCETTRPLQMSSTICKGFAVYGPEYFYPVPYFRAAEYFEPGEIKGEDPVNMYHLWNKWSSIWPVHKDSPYAKLARKYCPNTYKFYDRDFGI